MTDNTTNYLKSNTEITITKDIEDLSNSAIELWERIKDKTNKKVVDPDIQIYTDKYDIPIIELEWVKEDFYLSLRLFQNTEDFIVHYSDKNTSLNEIYELKNKLSNWLVEKLLIFIN